MKRESEKEEEELMNMYAEKFDDKVKELEKSKKNESSLSKSINQNQSVREIKNKGCLDWFFQIFTPDKDFLEPGQKKHIWVGKYGAFDKKFQDTREYRD